MVDLVKVFKKMGTLDFVGNPPPPLCIESIKMLGFFLLALHIVHITVQSNINEYYLKTR